MTPKTPLKDDLSSVY